MKTWIIILVVTALTGAATASAGTGSHAKHWGNTAIRPDINVFFRQLSPHGTWIHIPVHGWVWQPSVVATASDWRPYCDGGHWELTSDGWYWASDYSWGWAAFHYGRWLHADSRGWLWVPGYDYAPAWVEWRSTSAYHGWAPLAPNGSSLNVSLSMVNGHLSLSMGVTVSDYGYVFVPRHHVLSAALVQHRMPRSHYARIYRTSRPGHPLYHSHVQQRGAALRHTPVVTVPETRSSAAHRVVRAYENRNRASVALPYTPKPRVHTVPPTHSTTVHRQVKTYAPPVQTYAPPTRTYAPAPPTQPRRTSRAASLTRQDDSSSSSARSSSATSRSSRLHSLVRSKFKR